RKIVVIPNGGPSPLEIKEARKSDEVKFVFFGKLQPYNEFDVLFSAFEAHVRTFSKSRLIIIGDGKMRQFVEERCDAIENCSYHGVLSLKEAVRANLLERNSFGLIPLRKGLISQLLSPIKLYDYF